MLPQLVVLGTEAEMPGRNKVKEFTVGDRTVCIANVEGVFLAVDKNCLHGGGPLALNANEDGRSIRPSPDWRWNPWPATGHGAAARIEVYPVKIENNEVVIQLQMADHDVLADRGGPCVR